MWRKRKVSALETKSKCCGWHLTWGKETQTDLWLLNPTLTNALETVNKLPYLMKMEEVTLHPLKSDFIYFKWLMFYHSNCCWHLKHFHESPESSTGLTTALPVCSIKEGCLIHHLRNFFSVFLNISTSTTSQLFLELLNVLVNEKIISFTMI